MPIRDRPLPCRLLRRTFVAGLSIPAPCQRPTASRARADDPTVTELHATPRAVGSPADANFFDPRPAAENPNYPLITTPPAPPPVHYTPFTSFGAAFDELGRPVGPIPTQPSRATERPQAW